MIRASIFASVLALTLSSCAVPFADEAKDGAKEAVKKAAPETVMPPIAAAAKDCAMTRAVGDGGRSISFDTEGEEDTEGDSVDDIVCVLIKVNVPDHVLDHMDSTRAMDGMQTDTWDDLTARWNYHPDSGMSLTVFESSS